MIILNYLEKYLQENARRDSLIYIYNWIKENDIKKMIEFGTNRCDFEGNSTIFLALIAKEKGCKFISVDISEENIKNAKYLVEKFDSDLLDHIDFVCEDQYKYMSYYNDYPAQYIYLDCNDSNKDGAFRDLLKSKILDSKALICIDDMITQDSPCREQLDGVIHVINNCDNLVPLERLKGGELNKEQEKYRDMDREYLLENGNFDKYEKGVKQFEYQILVEWKISY